MNLFIEDVVSKLDYEPQSGRFVWRVSRGSVAAGSCAGSVDVINGYRQISINGKLYRAARLAWLFVNGEWPDGEVDHINHIRDDDRIENLRSVSRTENNRNHTLRKDNLSGIVGVVRRGSQWLSRIRVDRKEYRLYFGSDFFEACCARISASNKHGFHINHGMKEL